ncbi:MAG TPA: PfkB family carbohydrate kinase [Jatrophihabitans sp.]
MAEPAQHARVLVVGDVNPDLILRGDVVPRFGQAEQLLDSATVLIGGSAGITAHGLARLGRPVSLLAAVGDDAFGSGQRAELGAAGVDTDLIVTRADVGTGLTVVLSRAGDRAILTYPGAIPTLTVADVDQAIAQRPDVQHVHIASLYLQPALVAALPALLARLRASGHTVSLDTNDDPAGTWLGMSDLLPHVDVLLPNRAEAVALNHGACDDPAGAARSLSGFGPLVVVKNGEHGALAVAADGTELVAPGVIADLVDSTGAGDTFDAAFLDAWLGGAELITCLRRAVLAGALAVSAVGGTTTQPTPVQLRAADEPAGAERF